MISVIWLVIIVVSLIYGLFTNVIEVNNVILNVSYDSLDVFFEIGCGIIIWSGILEVAKTSGFLSFCTNGLNKITKRIFTTKNNETLSLISANLICNFIGLSSMATPFGLEAISNLKEKNKNDIDKLLVLNYVGVSILPISMITLRNSFDSTLVFNVIPIILIVGFINSILGLLLVRIFKCF